MSPMRSLYAFSLAALAASVYACSGTAASVPTSPAEDGSVPPPSATDDASAPPTTPDSSVDTPETASEGSDYLRTGSARVRVFDATLNNNAIHVLAPEGAPPSGGFPLVVFAHGFQLGLKEYDGILAHVASWGYVVVSTDFPSSFLNPDHRLVRQAILDARTAAVQGKINTLPPVDATKVFATGHSLGGKCATWAALGDSGFAGLFALDPVDRGGPTDRASTPERPWLVATQEVAKLTIPAGFFGATQSRCTVFGQTCAAEGSDAAAFFGAASAAKTKYLWVLNDFGHMQFLDNPSCAACNFCAKGSGDAALRTGRVKATFVAFLERVAKGEASAQRWLDGDKYREGLASKQLWDGTSDRPACR